MKLSSDLPVTMGIHLIVGDPPRAVTPQLLDLLAGIDELGSLRAAADRAGASYRHAWGLLETWQSELGHPLARLERGRGASLSGLGAALLAAQASTEKALRPSLSKLSRTAAAALADALPGRHADTVLCASHSLAVEVLRDLAKSDGRFSLDLHTCGSIEALRRLHAGECGLAGFHLPAGRAGRRLAHHYRRWLDPKTHRLLHVVDRVQGLMTAPGNPKGIHDLADLCRPGTCLVNRQPESGTRLLFDDLIEQAGIAPSQIDGYGTEEFTHMAVAAMVAGGVADAGFGIAAAAEKFNLAFIPMARETYFIAARRDDADSPLVSHLADLLKNDGFRRTLAGMAGYETGRSGSEVTVAEALGGR